MAIPSLASSTPLRRPSQAAWRRTPRARRSRGCGGSWRAVLRSGRRSDGVRVPVEQLPRLRVLATDPVRRVRGERLEEEGAERGTEQGAEGCIAEEVRLLRFGRRVGADDHAARGNVNGPAARRYGVLRAEYVDAEQVNHGRCLLPPPEREVPERPEHPRPHAPAP